MYKLTNYALGIKAVKERDYNLQNGKFSTVTNRRRLLPPGLLNFEFKSVNFEAKVNFESKLDTCDGVDDIDRECIWLELNYVLDD